MAELRLPFPPLKSLSMSNQLSNRRRSRRGTAITEFAIILPVFVLIVMGTIEATSMIFLQQSLEIAAYEATRVALVPGSEQGNVEAAANGILSGRKVVDAVVSVTPADFDDQPYGTAITVGITAECEKNSLFASWFYQNRELSSSVTMMKEN